MTNYPYLQIGALVVSPEAGIGFTVELGAMGGRITAAEVATALSDLINSKYDPSELAGPPSTQEYHISSSFL